MPWSSDANSWVTAIGFGALMVGMYSWSRFDEPSYDTQSEHFARYKPRFSTSYRRYARAKCGYVLAIILLYLFLAHTPDVYKALAGVDASANAAGTNIPLMVALALITLQNAPGLKDIERRIRGFLHAMARIPEGLRRTVAQMRGSPFTFRPEAVAIQTRKLGAANGGGHLDPGTLNRLLAENDVVHTWYSVGCLLIALKDGNQTKTGIDPLFFDYYRDELESIKARHFALAVVVREYLEATPAAQDAGDQSEPADLREIRDLRDRLYTFVACGVHSSVKTDAERYEILKKLGFAVINPPAGDPIRQFVGALAGLSGIAIAILSIFTVYSTQLFSDHVLRLDPVWKKELGVPPDTLGLFLWAWSTAAFYFSAIAGALAIRNTRVSKRQWFDINNLKRERPVLRYIAPTLVGTVLGCVTLTLIALFNGPGFSSYFGGIGQALVQALPWLPLATVMAFIAVWLSDSQLDDDPLWWRKVLIRGLYGGLAMMVAGFLTSQLNIASSVAAATSEPRLLDPTDKVIAAKTYLPMFLAAQIGLIALVLCIIVQLAEHYTARARSFAGQYLWAFTRQGPVFSVFFGPGGQATLFGAGAQRTNPGPFVSEGEWQQFPEGMAVRWHPGADGTHCSAGDFGLISKFGDSLIYEGYADRFGGSADFVAQIEARSRAASPRRQTREPPQLTPSASAPLQPAALDAPALAPGG